MEEEKNEVVLTPGRWVINLISFLLNATVKQPSCLLTCFFFFSNSLFNIFLISSTHPLLTLFIKIVVVGKCKGVTIDSCEQCEVTVDTTISAVELVNCKRMTVSEGREIILVSWSTVVCLGK